MRGLLVIAPAFLLIGCASVPDMMPLRTGTSWTYDVHVDFQTHDEPIKVARQTAIAGHDGFALQGPMGETTLAWLDKKLVAERLGVTRFDPPLPLLVLGSSGAVWQGKMSGLAGVEEASANLGQQAETITLFGKPYKTTRSTLSISSRKHAIELTTWFCAGYGIVKQEQLTDGRQNLSMELISGPTP